MRPLLAMLAILAFAGCGDELSRGIVITGSGKVGANNARMQRESVQDTLRIAIEEDLGTGWTVAVAIEELPEWVPDDQQRTSGMGEDGTWRWPSLTATVTITPPAGQTLADAKRAEIEAGSRDYLLRKLQRKDPARLSLGLIVRKPTPVLSPTPGTRTYVVQPGDTLADLSTAFYGTPQHWRLIAEANPGGTAPGTVIVIPPLPAAQAPAPAP